MSAPELLDIARSVAGTARAGEQVEAYVVRTRETDVEVFDGAVESLTTASVEGIGIRVIVGQRQGLAWAGSLAPDVIADSLNEARDNAGFGEPDEWYGLASPADVNGFRAPDLDLWREELVSVPTEEKVRIAIELERATKAADPRIRNVHELRTRASGPTVHIQMHVDLDPHQTLLQAHAIVEGAEARGLAAFPAADVLIHPDPEGHAEPHGQFGEETR